MKTGVIAAEIKLNHQHEQIMVHFIYSNVYIIFKFKTFFNFILNCTISQYYRFHCIFDLKKNATLKKILLNSGMLEGKKVSLGGRTVYSDNS